MVIVKLTKFGVDWYISFEMAAETARRGFVLIGLSRVSIQGVKSLWGDCRFIPADWGS